MKANVVILGSIIILLIAWNQVETKSRYKVFKISSQHEIDAKWNKKPWSDIAGLINELVELALSEHDHASNIFLQWFVSEQVEEEENVTGVLEQLKLMGEAKGGLFMIDRELAKRSPGITSGESEK